MKVMLHVAPMQAIAIDAFFAPRDTRRGTELASTSAFLTKG